MNRGLKCAYMLRLASQAPAVDHEKNKPLIATVPSARNLVKRQHTPTHSLEPSRADPQLKAELTI